MKQLGRYRLERLIGSGGMARVYLATCFGASGFTKRVAIKVLRPELRGVGEYERLLIEEARLGAQLEHRSLVSVLELGVDDGAYYVVMDWVDGADLATLTEGAAIEPELALLIAEEVALGLEYVHGHRDERGREVGLVHRDVSPSNILVSRAGEVKLADLGIAKATMLAEQTLTNIRKGKYAYMSPEQIDSAPLDATSDQFALGVTLVEMLTGARPFDGTTVLDTMEAIRSAPAPDLAELAEDVRSIVHRALAKRPEDRFSTAAALRAELAAARRRRPAVSPTELGAWARASLGDSD